MKPYSPQIDSPVLSVEEYLEGELHSAVKHEYFNGKLHEMSGGSYNHNKIKFEIAMMLEQFFRASGLSCEVLDSDMKTWFPELGKFVYPDVTVIAKPPRFFVSENGKIRQDAIVNPLLVVEVLSDETRDYDKGEKFEWYCTADSFREYLLIEPDKIWAKTIYLEDTSIGLQRVRTYVEPDAEVQLYSVGFSVRLADIYRVVAEMNR